MQRVKVLMKRCFERSKTDDRLIRECKYKYDSGVDFEYDQFFGKYVIKREYDVMAVSKRY